MESTNVNQQDLPNHQLVLGLGIGSIVACCCYGIFGIILGIVALSMASKGLKLYAENSVMYTEKSHSNIKTGKTCAMIGIGLSVLYFIYNIVVFFLYGALSITEMMNMYQELVENSSILNTLVNWLEANMLSCFYVKYFGTACPGCGMQRSLIALIKGDWLESFTLYPPLLFTLALVFYFVLHVIFKFNQGAEILKWLFILNASVVTINYIIKTTYSLY